MRILVLGDSLPFPRPLKGQPLPTTWPALLSEQIPDLELWQRARPRGSILDVKQELQLFTESLSYFDAIVIQAGIVDCAPRPYPYWLERLFEALLAPSHYRRVERFAHRHLLWLYRRPWVSPRRFALTVAELVRLAKERNSDISMLFLAIAPPNRAILANLPEIDRAANRYNEILHEAIGNLHSPAQATQVLDPYANATPMEITIEDGHHLSTRGHRLVADAIMRALDPRSTRHSVAAPRPLVV